MRGKTITDHFRCAATMGVMLPLLLAGPATAAQPQDNGVPARGIFKSGEDVYRYCSSTDAVELEKCYVYIMGAHDMVTYFQDLDLIKKTFCIPKATTSDQLRQTMLDYWRASPGSKRYSAVSNIINAFNNKYPGSCSDN